MEKSLCRVSMIFGVAAAILVAQGGKAQTVSETVTYFHTDRLGSTVMTSDASGNIQSTIDYRPYGQPVQNDPGSVPGYTGQYNDPATGLIYMRARYYDANVGQFLSVDPVLPDNGDVFLFSRFGYANTNPITYVDINGMKPSEPGGITVKGYNSTGTSSAGFSYGGGGVAAKGEHAFDRPDPRNAKTLDPVETFGYVHDFTFISGGMLAAGNSMRAWIFKRLGKNAAKHKIEQMCSSRFEGNCGALCECVLDSEVAACAGAAANSVCVLRAKSRAETCSWVCPAKGTITKEDLDQAGE